MAMLVFLVILHRGASAYAPENTLAAFDLAVQLGVHHIELDLQLTADGHVVVIHDDTVDRTTNATGAVDDFTLAALQELDAGSWFGAAFSGEKIPTFEEVLLRYKGQLHIHAEIKGRSPSLAQRTADLIHLHDMAEHVTITSFQQEALQQIHAYAPELQTGWLVDKADDAVINTAHALTVTQVCPKADTLTPETVKRLHDEGFVVRAWGVTNEELMRQVIESGADGMTVNFPDKLIAYLQNRGLPWG